jgi:membrane-associated phospholipid phosphatase
MKEFGAPWPIATRNTAIAVLVGLLALLFLLSFVDRPISVWGQGLPEPIPGIMHWITRWGESDWQLIPALLVLLLTAVAVPLVRKEVWRTALREVRVLAGFIFVGVGLPSLVSSLFKRLIGRARPEAWTETAPISFIPNLTLYNHQSFPSGHSTTAFAMAMVLVFIWPRTLWPALLAATLIALSRVITGQHYLTDIVGGVVLGTLGAYAIRFFFARRGWLFEIGPDGHIARKPFAGIRRLLSRG